ncbi:MAG: thiosulfohydrolase SoxB, partial [Betaproteobacteria bacterium]|nr:thiosulfohydrolase SoxB [Betaproteobacteria bacterium]
MQKREFLHLLGAASAAGISQPSAARAGDSKISYDVPVFGNVSLMHFTDCHAQLMPIYFREPSVNLGVGDAVGKPPHV